ncbi:hypothetical protein [Salinisphaera japonica]|uniref:Lipoprotein n=1 Tax=Salinisphaera japonica YTM-1 TaxID=1209778 RepID=A0A423PZQ6_9GAMM|nr:hypothetical protein [Salinisphaera japonica]ROO31186.1 hypothetical protein SAJA_03535 [Salinisphaera japonica YTM-1]
MRNNIVRQATFAASLVLALGLVGCGQSNTEDNMASEDAATPNAERHDDAAQADESSMDHSDSSDIANKMDEAAIRKHIVDHTVTGSMSTGGNYGEYYDPNGKILAADYSAKWTIEDDKLCFDYGDGVDCYVAAMDGLDVVWYLDGEKVGTGSLQEGNPNDFTGDADSENDSDS